MASGTLALPAAVLVAGDAEDPQALAARARAAAGMASQAR